MICPDENPLLGLVSLIAPALAMGNVVVAIPSEPFPLSATDLYQVFETSDLPNGVVNLITAKHAEVAESLAGHMDLDAVWYFGSSGQSGVIEKASATNLKRTWVNMDSPAAGSIQCRVKGRHFLVRQLRLRMFGFPRSSFLI